MRLRPCPHCGGPAELREWEWPYVRYQIRCAAKCTGGRKASKEEAIACWNIRGMDSDAVQRIARRMGAEWVSRDSDHNGEL